MALKSNRREPEVATDHIREYQYRERLMTLAESCATYQQGGLCVSHASQVRRSSDDDLFTSKVRNFQPQTAEKVAENCTPPTRIPRSLRMQSSRQVSNASAMPKFALQTFVSPLQSRRATILTVAPVSSQTDFCSM